MKKISLTEYHSIPGVSASVLKLMAMKTPLHVWHEYLSPERIHRTNPSMKMGSLVHALTLEPETVEDRFPVFSGDRRTKAGKEAWASLIDSGGADPVTESEFEQALAIATAVRTDAHVIEILDCGEAEVSLFQERGKGLLPLKARLDFLTDAGMILELKMTVDASPLGFAAQVYRFGYHLQAAIYMELAGIENLNQFVFVSVEKTPPYPVGIYLLSEEVLDDGRRLYRDMLEKFDTCWVSDEWPGYGCGLIYRPGRIGRANDEIPLGELEI